MKENFSMHFDRKRLKWISPKVALREVNKTNPGLITVIAKESHTVHRAVHVSWIYLEAIGHAWKISRESHPWGIVTRCQNHLNQLLLTRPISSSTLSSLRMSALLTLSLRPTPSTLWRRLLSRSSLRGGPQTHRRDYISPQAWLHLRLPLEGARKCYWGKGGLDYCVWPADTLTWPQISRNKLIDIVSIPEALYLPCVERCREVDFKPHKTRFTTVFGGRYNLTH